MLSGKSYSPGIQQSKRDPVFITSYQNQRTDAWMRSTQNSPAAGSQSASCIPRASSALVGGSCSRVSVQAAGEWLGGGRDLFREDLQNRPKSGHVPGWKEGVDELKTRPKSAVPSRTLRRSRTTTPVTPSSMAYDAVHGTRTAKALLQAPPGLIAHV
ncbi:hypothetical protein ScPMuIL_000600 [Solemya velum]